MTPRVPTDMKGADGLSAYRAELRRVAWLPRSIGLGLVLAAAVAILALRAKGLSVASPLGVAALGLMILGWAVLAFVIVKRSAYLRRRVGGV